MDARYEQFCLADRIFYDSPTRSALAKQRFAAGLTLPADWHSKQKGTWTLLIPPDVSLPAQGWKIHVSATLENAAQVLAKVWEYCVPRQITFKHLTDRAGLLLCNAKYADRSGSGKFATIYPKALDELERTLRELDAALEGSPGPYILSDLRWNSGPLYVRYGGFAERYCKLDGGGLCLAIADPDGQLVPDPRRPTFTLPPWVGSTGVSGGTHRCQAEFRRL
jgi:hypothetical protein